MADELEEAYQDFLRNNVNYLDKGVQLCYNYVERTEKMDKQSVPAQFGFGKGTRAAIIVEVEDEKEIEKYLKDALGYGDKNIHGLKVESIVNVSKTEELMSKQLESGKKQISNLIDSIIDSIVGVVDGAVIKSGNVQKNDPIRGNCNNISQKHSQVSLDLLNKGMGE